MKKNRFEDLEVLPISVVEELGNKLDQELKKKFKECIDEMDIDSWYPIYKVENIKILEWLKSIIDKYPPSCQLWNTEDGLVFRFNLIPEDYDKDFSILIPVDKVVKDAEEMFWEDSETIKRITEFLRRLADAIENNVEE
jgi:hypothetical protein